MSALLFSTIEVTRQAFYRVPLAFAIVNLKPIVPGHVLVVPARPVKRIADLDAAELGALMTSVQRVGHMIEKAYNADGLTVACQDGKAAGQSVPHVHFHLLPRKFIGDCFTGDNNDKIYPALEKAEAAIESDLSALRNKLPDELQDTQSRLAHRHNASGVAERQGVNPLKMDADAERPPRTMEEMVKEAEWLKSLFNEDERP